jgi:hypothetical protein
MTGLEFVEAGHTILKPAAELSRFDLLLLGVPIKRTASHTKVFRGGRVL